MSLTAETPIRELVGNGITTAFDHAPTFTLSDSSHLEVTLDGVVTTAYTQTSTGVIFTTAPASGVAVVLRRVTPKDQPGALTDPTLTDLAEVTNLLDRIVRISQENGRDIQRSLRLPHPETASEFAAATSRLSRFLHFNSATGAPELYTYAQVAAAILAELNLGTSTPDRPTAVCADATARAALAPAFSGQLLVQLSDLTLWTANGTSAGDWTREGDREFSDEAARLAATPDYKFQLAYQLDAGSVWIASGERAGDWHLLSYTRPAVDLYRVHEVGATYTLGEYVQKDGVLYQGNTATVTTTPPGGSEWLNHTWLDATSYSTGDYVSLWGMVWKCLADHTSSDGGTSQVNDGPGDNQPGVGADWPTYWEPVVIKGFHWDFGRRFGDEDSHVIFLAPGNRAANWYWILDQVQKLLPSVGGGDNQFTTPPAWTLSTAYTVDDREDGWVLNDGKYYRCILGHTATANDEPGVGPSWTTYWYQEPGKPWEGYGVAGDIAFTGGDYYSSHPLKQAPLVTFRDTSSAALYRGSLLWARTTDWKGDRVGDIRNVLLCGIERNPGGGSPNGASNFGTSILGLKIHCQHMCGGIFWPAAEWSRIEDVRIHDFSKSDHPIGLDMASVNAHCEIEDLWIDGDDNVTTALTHHSRGIGIYAPNNVNAMMFKGLHFTYLLKGIQCDAINKGITIDGGDFELVRMPFVFYDCEDSSHLSEAGLASAITITGVKAAGIHLTAADWADATAYSAGTIVVSDNTNHSYTCSAGHTSASSTKPESGGSWATVWTADWTTSKSFAVGDWLVRSNELYVCKVAHTSASADEPGVGANWGDYWERPFGASTSFTAHDLNGCIALIRYQSQHVGFRLIGCYEEVDTGPGFNKVGIIGPPTASWDAFQTTTLKTGNGGLEFDLKKFLDNPSIAGGTQTHTFSANGANTFSSLAIGVYEVAVVGTTWGGGSLTFTDEDSNNLPNLASLTADRTRYLFHNGGDVTATLTGATSPDITITLTPKYL